VVAADAGAMQIQLGKGRGLRCTEAALRSMALHTATARAAWSQKSVAKMVVEEAWKAGRTATWRTTTRTTQAFWRNIWVTGLRCGLRSTCRGRSPIWATA